MQYLERGWCSTYLVVDEDSFDNNVLNIQGYFTLSHKALIPRFASKGKIKETGGFKEAESIHFVLIGQLGRYIDKNDDAIIYGNVSGNELLNYAMEIIRSVDSLIPCRCALVECSDNVKLHEFYTKYGFKFFQQDELHYQFYIRI